MHNYCKTIGALAAASALVAGTASAEIEGEVRVGYTSEYLFRGLNLGTDLIDANVTVGYEVAGLNVSVGAWYGSFDAPIGGGFDTDADELNLYAEVSKDLGFATAAVGFIYYYYPQGDLNELVLGRWSSTSEAYISLRRDFGFADFALTYFHDVKGDNDGYSELTVGKRWELNRCLALNTHGTLGYLVEQGQFAHFTAKVSLDYNFAGTARFSPFVAHSWALSDDNDTAYFGSKNELVGGAMISVAF